jgi:Na+/H+ antiporter NhaC
MEFGILSLLPPLIAIILCFLTRRVLVSLFVGIWIGAMLVVGWNPISAVTMSFDWIVTSFTDEWNATILIFDFVVGGLIGLMIFAGGPQAVANSITKRVKTARGGQLASWAIGTLVFFDDYSDTLIQGNTCRPITDKLKISREKLSYLVDATCAPVASIAPVGTWVGYEVGLIGSAVKGVGIEEAAYSIFLKSIPFRFYSLLAIILCLLIVITRRDYGPMLKAEYRARKTGKLLRDGATPMQTKEVLEMKPKEGIKLRSINMVIPLLVLVGVTIFGIFFTGGWPKVSAMEALAETNTVKAILWGSVWAVIVALILFILQGMKLGELMESFIAGARMMVFANLILILAWSIGLACENVGTAPYVVGAVKEVVNPAIIPVLIFLSCCFIAFCTGTSWATMAIMMPIAVPLSVVLGAPLYATIAGVLTGAVFGDHCSPISDTTIMSSMFSGADHMDHVKTQIPYAITAAVGATVAFLLVPFIGIAALVVGLILVVTLLYLLSNWWSKKTGKKLTS